MPSYHPSSCPRSRDQVRPLDTPISRAWGADVPHVPYGQLWDVVGDVELFWALLACPLLVRDRKLRMGLLGAMPALTPLR